MTEMTQITKKELRELVLKTLLENEHCESDEHHFIININGITIYYSAYKITDIDNDEFSIGFDGWNGEKYQCTFNSWSMNILYINYRMYEII